LTAAARAGKRGGDGTVELKLFAIVVVRAVFAAAMLLLLSRHGVQFLQDVHKLLPGAAARRRVLLVMRRWDLQERLANLRFVVTILEGAGAFLKDGTGLDQFGRIVRTLIVVGARATIVRVAMQGRGVRTRVFACLLVACRHAALALLASLAFFSRVWLFVCEQSNGVAPSTVLRNQRPLTQEASDNNASCCWRRVSKVREATAPRDYTSYGTPQRFLPASKHY